MFALGDLLFDPVTRRVIRGAEERKLSPKATAVLLALAETPRRVWSRSALMERVWPGVYVGDEVLTHAVAELRGALNDSPRSPRYLETVHKSGYRLLQPLAPRDEEESAPQPFESEANDIGLDAYTDYLSACDYYDKGGRRNTLTAIALFSSVVEQHPAFALAHAGLAKALAMRSIFYPSHADLTRALDHCSTAHRTSGASPEAYAVEGLIYTIMGDAARSAQCFASSVARNPESAETHYLLARACIAESQFARAAIMFGRAARLQPLDYRSLVMAGKMRQITGDQRRSRADLAMALPRVEYALSARPNDSHALCYKARCLLELERSDEARSILASVAEHSDDPTNYNFACTLARAGFVDHALDVLEEVVELGWRYGSWLQLDPDFDSVRGEARLSRIAASI